VILTSSGESSGAVRSEGSSSTASAGSPAWIAASVLAEAAKGCGRADRIAWLRLLTAGAESSAHRHKPPSRDQNPCSASMSGCSRGLGDYGATAYRLPPHISTSRAMRALSRSGHGQSGVAGRRQETARTILDRLSPLERWRPFGEPVLCGAVSYGLLVAPDIDIEVFGRMDAGAGFSIVADWAAKMAVRRALFLNAMGEEDAGLGWDVQYRHRGEVWHIQMWLLPPDYSGPRSCDLAPAMNHALNNHSRCAILRIKEYLVSQRSPYRSIDVYRAVLDYGVSNAHDYRRWAISHSTTGLITWRPSRGPHNSHPIRGGDP
jgi:hypothetical protein